MKIVIFSDSHGNCGNMRETLKKERPGMVFYLGDGLSDIEQVMEQFPEIELHKVAGNCDWRRDCPNEELVLVQGIPMLLAHGHLHGVKSGYESYLRYGQKRGMRVLFSGHTHDACIWEDRGVTILNPGSVGSYYAPTYGVVEAEDGLIRRMVIRKVEHPVYER